MTDLITVVELPEFLKRCSPLMNESKRTEIVTHIALNPLDGVSLGAGLRKVRIASKGRGKSGCFRVIYVFGGRDIPIFLITIFAKNEKANIISKEQEILKQASKELIQSYRSKKQ